MRCQNPQRPALQKIIARNRQRPSGIAKPFNRVSAYFTPEGFRFAYDRWARNPKPGYVMVQAATASNPFLPDDYGQALRESYPAALIEAYLEGRFTNLNAGSVYPDFSRVGNHTDAVLAANEPVHIGMDFNRLKMSAVIYVLREGWPIAVVKM